MLSLPLAIGFLVMKAVNTVSLHSCRVLDAIEFSRLGSTRSLEEAARLLLSKVQTGHRRSGMP